jgi:hypothetical protein
MAGPKVLILEMRVRHLPPEPSKKEAHSMRRNQLKLVVVENGVTAATDGPAEIPAVAARPDVAMRWLRVDDADEGAPPDDAA